MKHFRITQYLAFVLLIFLCTALLTACKTTETSSIGEVVTARNTDADSKPVDSTTTFRPTDTVHTSVQVNNLIVGSKVVAKYIFGGQIDEQPLVADKAGSGYFDFSLSPGTSGFPEGDYTVEIYLDDTLVKTVTFQVVKSPISVGKLHRLSPVNITGEDLMSTADKLAQRMRAKLGQLPGFIEKKIFGGIVYLLHGNIACGINTENLVIRVGVDKY